MLVEFVVETDDGTQIEYLNSRHVARIRPGPKPKGEQQPKPLSLITMADKTVVRVSMWPREVHRSFETKGGNR